MKPFIQNLDETYKEDIQTDPSLANGDSTFRATLYKFIQWTIEV